MLCIYITPFLTLLDPTYSLTTCVQCVAEVFNSSSAWRSNRSVIMGSSLFLVGHQYCFEIWNTVCVKVMRLLVLVNRNCCWETWNTDCVKVMRRTLFIVYCHCWYATWHAECINVMRVILYNCTPLLLQYLAYRPHQDIDVPILSSLMRCDTQNTSRSWAHFF